MITVTSVEAQSRFGELIDRSMREPIAITRRGRPVAYVVCEQDMHELTDVKKRREEAVRWFTQYRNQIETPTAADSLASALTDDEVNRLVHELRANP